jgi:hypothetical protein
MPVPEQQVVAQVQPIHEVGQAGLYVDGWHQRLQGRHMVTDCPVRGKDTTGVLVQFLIGLAQAPPAGSVPVGIDIAPADPAMLWSMQAEQNISQGCLAAPAGAHDGKRFT